jgi:hypothetical protein
MRSTYSRIWIACCLLSGFLVVASVPQAEAQLAVPDEASTSRLSATPTTADPSPPMRLQPSSSPVRSSVSLSPAVAVMSCKLGQSKTQTLTLTNRTDQQLAFEMIAEDVVVRDGKRVFVLAGETPEGIASTAVFTQKQVVIPPLQSSSVGVTFTVPPGTALRAAVAMFRGSTKLRGQGAVKMTASLGTLFTFTTSQNFNVATAPLTVTAQSSTANLRFSQILTNTGSEPVIVDGVAAVLDPAGAIVGKATFDPQRLLPGERLPFQTEYSAELKTGSYRVLASFQYEGKVITSSNDFTVP